MPNPNPANTELQEIADAAAQAGYDKGWNACLDAAKKWVLSFRAKLDDDDEKTDLELRWLAERLEALRK